MKVTGRCYCGKIRYAAQGDVLMRLQCHCRECQYISGGNANVVMGMAKHQFHYVQGEVKQFQRADIDNAVIRDFCPDCGTHLVTCAPRLSSMVLIKVGTLDDPGVFGKPDMAIFTAEKQRFHVIPDDLPSFEKMPVRRE